MFLCEKHGRSLVVLVTVHFCIVLIHPFIRQFFADKKTGAFLTSCKSSPSRNELHDTIKRVNSSDSLKHMAVSQNWEVDIPRRLRTDRERGANVRNRTTEGAGK